MLPLLAACGDDAEKPAGPADTEARDARVQGDPEKPLRALLTTLSRGGTKALESCGLDVVLDEKRFQVALTKNGNMRREHKAGGGIDTRARRVDKRFEGKSWTSAAAEVDASRRWRAMTEEETREMEALRLLLGSVLAWDLLDDAASEEPTRRATWFRETSAPVIHREFDDAGVLRVLSVDGARWHVTGWHEERGGVLPELRLEDKSSALRFDRVSLGSRFLSAYFAPEQFGEESKAPILPRNADGGEETRYGVPQLEHSPGASFLEADCGDTWAERLAVIRKLGEELGKLGQRPAGLPAYVPGKVRIYFASQREGEAAKAPEGYEVQTRKPGNVVAIQHKGIAFRDAREKLEPVLRAFAKKRGYFPDGPVFLLPFELPRAEPAGGPADGDPVEIRVELRIR